jgi:hypothetical protein
MCTELQEVLFGSRQVRRWTWALQGCQAYVIVNNLQQQQDPNVFGRIQLAFGAPAI